MNRRFIEVWSTLEGRDAAILDDLVYKYNVKYEKNTKAYTYYRLRGTRRVVRDFSKDLINEGFNAILMDNKYFHVYERNERIM